MNNDIFGVAIQDFYHHQYSEDIVVQAHDFDDDIIPIPYLFRTYPGMPALEQKALDVSKGSVLDVGCGAGSHSLYLQEEKKLEVTAIDISKGAIDVCKARGIKKANVQNLFEWQHKTYDTILMLMNGSGIIGKLNQIAPFFEHIKILLSPGGQILLDSSDISYLYTDEEGGFWIDASAGYYGEMQYRLQYKNQQSDWFDWLYIDYNNLQNAAGIHGFMCELLAEGEHYEYLARLTVADDFMG